MAESHDHQPIPENPEDKNMKKWKELLTSPRITELTIAQLHGMRLQPADVEDVLQRARVNAIRAMHRESFRTEAEFSSWFYVIVRNTALTFFREQKRQRKNKTGDLADAYDKVAIEPTPEKLYAAAEEMERLRYYIDELTPKLREVVNLRLKDLTNEQIAEELGITAPAVRVRYFRAEERLRQLAAEAGEK